MVEERKRGGYRGRGGDLERREVTGEKGEDGERGCAEQFG